MRHQALNIALVAALMIAGLSTATSSAALTVNVVSMSNTVDQIPPSSTPSAPAVPLDVPQLFVNSGYVSDFMRVNTVLYWHTAGSCYTPPGGPDGGDQPLLNPGDVAEAVTRTSTINFVARYIANRELYYKDLRVTNSCNPYVFSRVVADNDNLYWVDATGLVKLSRNATPSDTPQVLSASFSDQKPYQIAVGSQYVYVSRDGYEAGCPLFCHYITPVLDRIDKTSGVVSGLDCQLVTGCPVALDLKVDPGERYLYYLDGSGNLQRMDLSNPASITQLAAQVHSYYPEGSHLICIQLNCLHIDFVFIGLGATAAGQPHQIVRYDNLTNTSAVIYTSSDTTDTVSINDITSDGNNLFFFEVRTNSCAPFCSYTAWLYRSGRSNASGLANIYQSSGNVGIATSLGLDTDGVKLYWQESGNIYRLGNQATALPQSPMRITGMEVIQSVQTPNNTVPLIKGKRTFVRVYVRSDDPTRDVPAVTARLSATWTGGSGDWIEPSNVLAITVKRTPSRQNLNDAFLFELPWEWVNGDNLQLTAELNPAHNPEQSDGYVNNVMTVGPFHLNPSPRLEVRLFEYFYAMGGSVFGPGYTEKFDNIDWIRRAYPVAESNGNMQTPGGGLRWSWTTVRDDALANYVRYPSVPCEDKDTTPADKQDPNLPDCQNLRASAYVASQIAGMRDSLKGYGDTDNTSYYGLIAPGSEQRGTPPMTVTYFPRGQDGAKNAAGPAGKKYLGWYAAHEVGHSVGLGHPATAAAGNECGIKGNDSYPTNPHGDIGSDDDTTNAEGFLDTPSYNYPRYDNSNLAVGSQTKDVMAYCLPQWLSDQNYVRIYQNLTGTTPHGPTIDNPQQNGDWLVVYGSIISGTNTAYMDYLNHTIGNVTVPPLVPGNYAIRLRDASGNVLHDYAFTPDGGTDSPALMFGQAVTLTAGTRDVRIVRLSDQQVLADQLLSVNPPTISSIDVISTSLPATGVVTVTWSASDSMAAR